MILFKLAVERGNFNVNISGLSICITTEPSNCQSMNNTQFTITISNTEGRELYTTQKSYENNNMNNCVTTDVLLLAECLPLIVSIMAANPLIEYQPHSPKMIGRISLTKKMLA